MKLTLDIYHGSQVQGVPKEEITVKRARDGMTACRRRAMRIWDKVERVHPDDDGIVSYGPQDGDGYVTLRRLSE